MAMKITPPDFNKCKTYERYKLELKAWQEVTDIAKKKLGIDCPLAKETDSKFWITSINSIRNTTIS